MMKKLSVVLATAMLILGITGTTNATILSIDLFSQNDSYLTYDSSTGLAWLDLTLTQGRSYSEIVGGFGGYTTTLGFRYASYPEVAELVANAGYTIPAQFPIPDGTNYGTDPENYTALYALISYLEITSYTFSTAPTSSGLTSTPVPLFFPPDVEEGRLGIYLQVGPHPTHGEFYSVLSNSGYFVETEQTSWQGSFLVRQQHSPVPEPPSILLLGTGLAGLAVIKTRRKRK